MGNLAQIYAPYFYLPQHGPRYLLAMVANAGFCVACVGATLLLRRCLMKENRVLLGLGIDEEREDELDEFQYVL
jgi:hypothetical protein